MLTQLVERRASDALIAKGAAECSPGMACRLVQISLAIYLMPVIAVVVLVGSTAVISGSVFRAAGRMMSGQPAGSPLVTKASKKDDLRPHSASRPGRSRVV